MHPLQASASLFPLDDQMWAQLLWARAVLGTMQDGAGFGLRPSTWDGEPDGGENVKPR